MRALLVDDEPLARRELRRLLAVHAEVEVVGDAANADEAARAIETLAPDLVFLDIQMPQRSGFELLESLDELPSVIFTTAYEEHALEAFEVGAVDYLLKPIAPARLAASLARVAGLRTLAPRQFAAIDRPLLLRDGSASWVIRLQDVALFEAVGNYVQVHANGRKPLLLRSLSEMERRLDPKLFARASRTHIVNLNFVERFETGVRGELAAHLRGGLVVTFSRRQSVVFRRRAEFP